MITKKLEKELRKMAHDFEAEKIGSGICGAIAYIYDVPKDNRHEIKHILFSVFDFPFNWYKTDFLAKGYTFYKPENSHIRAIIIYLIIEILKDENDTTLH